MSNVNNKNKVSEIESPTREEKYINIPLGTRLNFNPSPEEFENLKALSDEDGYIKFGG